MRYLAEAIRMKLEELEKEVQLAMTSMVVDSFKNPLAPLKALLQDALSNTGECLMLYLYTLCHSIKLILQMNQIWKDISIPNLRSLKSVLT